MQFVNKFFDDIAFDYKTIESLLNIEGNRWWFKLLCLKSH